MQGQSKWGRDFVRVDRELPSKVLKRVGQVRRLGIRGFARTVYALTAGPAAYALMQPAMHVRATRLRARARNKSHAARLELLEERVGREIDEDRAPLLREIDPEADARLAAKRIDGLPVALGEFGEHGRILSLVGPIAGVPCVSADEFTPRGGGRIELVDRNGRLGVRKSYGSGRGRFLQALEAGLDLAPVQHTPRVLAVDWHANAITSAFVSGSPAREATSGSRPPVERAIEQSLLAIHRAGYVLGRIQADDLVIAPDGTPVFLNLAHALPLAGLSRDMSIYLRDLDSARCNALFGTRLITAAHLRSGDLAPQSKAAADRAYASILIRDDIRWGRIWNTDVATGRWNYFLAHHLPIPQRGAVLDLGSNNGFNPLQMLRRGAASAVAVEYNAEVIRDGEFLKAAFEWLDNRDYDLRFIHGSFADLPAWGLGRFDMVTALCSLYYLDDAQMGDLARYIRTLTDMFVLQCNTDRLIHRNEEDRYRRASVQFALELLERAGFAERQVIAPPGYSRPLVIGRAAC